MLDPPIPVPAPPVPELDVRGEPSASIEQDGVRIEAWVPDEGAVGMWLPIAVRVTNTGTRRLFHEGDTIGVPCVDPTVARLAVKDLFTDVPPVEGNEALIAERILTTAAPWSLGFEHPVVEPGRRVCSGSSVGRTGWVAPGRSFIVRLGAVPIYTWRNQPLPSGSATVTVGFAYWRRPVTSRAPRRLELVTPVKISGGPVGYPSPQAVLHAALSDPAIVGWVATRDLSMDWNATVGGIAAVGEASPAPDEAGGVAGPAPEETIRISISAVGSTPASLAIVLVDPWTLEVVSVELL